LTIEGGILIEVNFITVAVESIIKIVMTILKTIGVPIDLQIDLGVLNIQKVVISIN
jgi:hypothetical protein